MVKDKKKVKFNSLYQKIETEEQSLKVIKDVSLAFYVLAAIQLVVFLYLGEYLGIIDSVIYALLGFLLWKFESRTAAILLTVFAIFSLIMTVYNGIVGGAGTNMLLAILMVWFGIRAIQASYKYQSMK